MRTSDSKVRVINILAMLVITLVAPVLVSAAETTPVVESVLGREALRALIARSLPIEIGENNQELARKLLNPQVGIPISERFNSSDAIKTLIGDRAVLDPGCSNLITPTGVTDPGDCIASKGNAAGTKAYRALRFSKNMAFGNITFLSRSAVVLTPTTNIKPIVLSNFDAYKKANNFLIRTFGLDSNEIYVTSSTADGRSVKTLILGWEDENGKSGSVSTDKLILLERGFFVGLGGDMDWVPGPGKAIVVMDDTGIKEAIVKGWREVRSHPDADPAKAKTRTRLVEEITDDLMKIQVGPFADLKFRLALTAKASSDGIGLLLPTIQSFVSPLPKKPSKSQLSQVVSTAGQIRQYYLVEPTK